MAERMIRIDTDLYLSDAHDVIDEEGNVLEEQVADLTLRGGPGSGHHKHKGIIGEVGGSLPAGAAQVGVGKEPLPAGGPDSEEAQIDKSPFREQEADESEVSLEEIEDISESVDAIFVVVKSAMLKPHPLGMALDHATGIFLQDMTNLLKSAVDRAPDWLSGESDDRTSQNILAAFGDVAGWYREIFDKSNAWELMTRPQREPFDKLFQFVDKHRGAIDQAMDDALSNMRMIAEGTSEEPRDMVDAYFNALPGRASESFLLYDRMSYAMSEAFQKLPDEVQAGDRDLYGLDLKVVFSSDQDDMRNLPPDIKESVVDTWLDRALDPSSTGEFRYNIAHGGSDPYWHAQNVAMESDGQQWIPPDEENLSKLADTINGQWAHTTALPGSILFSEVVAERFGGMPIPRDRYDPSKTSAEVAQPELLEDSVAREQTGELVDRMYQRTQEWLAERGYKPGDTVRLYRGMGNLRNQEWNPEGVAGLARVDMWSTSSWTYDPTVAYSFAEGSKDEGEEASVVVADIPIERLLANSDTGPPCEHEGEWIVTGGSISATVYPEEASYQVLQYGLPVYTNSYDGALYGKDYQQMLIQSVQDRKLTPEDVIGQYVSEVPESVARSMSIRAAVSIGGALSVPEGSGIQPVDIQEEPVLSFNIDEVSGDWIGEGLAKFDLDRILLDHPVNIPEEEREERLTRYGKTTLRRDREKRRADQAAIEEASPESEPVQRHYGPGPHPGTGTPQEVHGSQPNMMSLASDLSWADVSRHEVIDGMNVYGNKYQPNVWAVDLGDGEFGPWENSPEKAMESAKEFLKESEKSSKLFEREKKRRNKLLDRIKEGNLDQKTIELFAGQRSGVTTSEAVALMRELGLTADKAQRLVAGMGVVSTTSGGAILRDPQEVLRRAIFNATGEWPEDWIERHYGPGDHPGTGTPQEVHGGDGGISPSVSEAAGSAVAGEFTGFKVKLPNEKRVKQWLIDHHFPLDLADHYARAESQTYQVAFKGEQYERFQQAMKARVDDALAELEDKDLRNIDREEFLRSDEQYELMDALSTHADQLKEEGHEEDARYVMNIWSEVFYATRQREDAMEFAVRRAVASGEISVDEAMEIDAYDFGRFHGSIPWNPLPDTLYHTTVAASAIRETGIKSRFELGGGQGLGGGNDQTISYTASREWAEHIERAVQEAHLVGSGEVTAENLMEFAAKGADNRGNGFLSTLMSYSGIYFSAFKNESEITPAVEKYFNSSDFDPTAPIPEDVIHDERRRDRAQDWLNLFVDDDTIQTDLAKKITGNRYFPDPDELAEAMTQVTDDQVQREKRERAFQLFKGPYLYARQEAGGPENPLIWGGSHEDFAEIDPNEIRTFVFNPKEGAMGGRLSALDEWRSYGGDNVEIVDELNLFEPEDLFAVERSFVEKAANFIRRGGPGSGHHGHKGRPDKVGGSLPEGGYATRPGKPGVEVYGSGVFTPELKDVIYSWQGSDGWGIAQMIYTQVEQAQRNGNENVEGLAIGQDGILQAIGALKYSVAPPQGAPDEDQWVMLNGLYSHDPSYSDEAMVQVAAEAAKHNAGVFMKLGSHSGPLAAQMGMKLFSNDEYAYWTAEQVQNIASTFETPEQVDYFDPPSKPRILTSFDDAFEEHLPENPSTNRPPPPPISEMDMQERYRWENFNYSNWATPERWEPEAFGRELMELGEEDEATNVYEARGLENLQALHDGWQDGTDNMASVLFSEGVADEFGGEPIPRERVRYGYDNPRHLLADLLLSYEDPYPTSAPTEEEFFKLAEEQQWNWLTNFKAFAEGTREEDLAIDYSTVARTMYERTQSKFREAGFEPSDTVRLYRGLRANPEDRLDGADGGWARLDMWSISSWSSAKSIAGNFATMGGGSGTESGVGTLLTADVPVERILANWTTGPGSHGEFEYLVLGQDGIQSYATKVTEKANAQDIADQKAAQAAQWFIQSLENDEASFGNAIGPEME